MTHKWTHNMLLNHLWHFKVICIIAEILCLTARGRVCVCICECICVHMCMHMWVSEGSRLWNQLPVSKHHDDDGDDDIISAASTTTSSNSIINININIIFFLKAYEIIYYLWMKRNCYYIQLLQQLLYLVATSIVTDIQTKYAICKVTKCVNAFSVLLYAAKFNILGTRNSWKGKQTVRMNFLHNHAGKRGYKICLTT